MPSISTVIIYKNEERWLGECLASLAGTVDEIVAVDTGSSDDGPALARAAGAQCAGFAWNNDFAAARNFALEQACGDYALVIDADERIENREAARALLDGFMAAHAPDVVGTVEIINVLPDGTEAVDHTERFFHRASHRYEGAIHEQIAPRAGVKRAAPTGVRLRHWGYAQAADSPDHKARRNLSLLHAALTETPNDEYYLFQMGKAHFALGEYAAAAAALEAALAAIRFEPGAPPMGRIGPVSREVLTGAVVTLAYALANMGKLDDAAARLARHAALDHPGVRRADFHHALGYIHLMRGDMARARAAFLDALQWGSGQEDVRGTGSFSSAYHLALIEESAGDLPGAFTWLVRALAMKPNYRPALARCVDLITERRVVPPEAVLGVCDMNAFAQCYLERLEAVIRAKNAEGAAMLLQTAGHCSEALPAACEHLLAQLLNP